MDGPYVVGQDPPTGIDRKHESRETRSLYLLALQLTRTPEVEVRWACHLTYT
jgi:hypothetical protein